MSWQLASCSGKSVTFFQVLLFCCHRLNMVHNVPFFFEIQSIGMASLSAVGIHHPAMVYLSIFWASSGQNASGHLGNLCLSCFDSSIKGILWRTSWSSGSSNGSGPNKSLNDSTILSHPIPEWPRTNQKHRNLYSQELGIPTSETKSISILKPTSPLIYYS